MATQRKCKITDFLFSFFEMRVFPPNHAGNHAGFPNKSESHLKPALVKELYFHHDGIWCLGETPFSTKTPLCHPTFGASHMSSWKR